MAAASGPKEYAMVVIQHNSTSNQDVRRELSTISIYRVPYEGEIARLVPRGQTTDFSVDNTMRGATRYFGRGAMLKAETLKTDDERNADRLIALAQPHEEVVSNPWDGVVVATAYIEEFLSH
jgi:hypothetical protein